MIVYDYNISTGELEAGGSEVQVCTVRVTLNGGHERKHTNTQKASIALWNSKGICMIRTSQMTFGIQLQRYILLGFTGFSPLRYFWKKV